MYQIKKIENQQVQKKYIEIAKQNTLEQEYYLRKAERLQLCSNYLEFWRAQDGERYKLVRTNSCRVRLCPICAYKRSLAVYRNVRTAYDYLCKEIKRPKLLFITLTVKNVPGDNLAKAIDSLNYSLRKLTQYKKIKKINLGIIRSIEINYNAKRNDYHPHIHILLLTSNDLYYGRNYISKAELRNLWTSSANLDYIPQVDIEKAKGDTGATIAEIAKYSVKPGDYEGQPWYVLRTLDKVLHKRQLITFSGAWRTAKKACKIKDLETHEEYLGKLDKGESIIYFWHFGKSEYQQKKKK